MTSNIERHQRCYANDPSCRDLIVLPLHVLPVKHTLEINGIFSIVHREIWCDNWCDVVLDRRGWERKSDFGRLDILPDCSDWAWITGSDCMVGLGCMGARTWLLCAAKELERKRTCQAECSDVWTRKVPSCKAQVAGRQSPPAA